MTAEGESCTMVTRQHRVAGWPRGGPLPPSARSENLGRLAACAVTSRPEIWLLSEADRPIEPAGGVPRRLAGSKAHSQDRDRLHRVPNARPRYRGRTAPGDLRSSTPARVAHKRRRRFDVTESGDVVNVSYTNGLVPKLSALQTIVDWMNRESASIPHCPGELTVVVRATLPSAAILFGQQRMLPTCDSGRHSA